MSRIPEEWIDQWTQLMQADARIMDKEEHNEHLQHKYEAALQKKLKVREALITDLTKEKNRLISLSIQYSKRISELEDKVSELYDNEESLLAEIEDYKEAM